MDNNQGIGVVDRFACGDPPPSPNNIPGAALGPPAPFQGGIVAGRMATSPPTQVQCPNCRQQIFLPDRDESGYIELLMDFGAGALVGAILGIVCITAATTVFRHPNAK